MPTIIPTPSPVPSNGSRYYLPIIGRGESKAGVVWLDIVADDPQWLGFNWYYDYSVIDRLQSPEYVPMIWCDTWPANGGGFHYMTAAVANLGTDYDGWLMILNEPELPTQCDMTPLEASIFYGQIVTTFPQARIVGPNISSEGLPWLADWYGRIIAAGLPLPEVAGIHSYLDEDPLLLLNRLTAVLDDYPGAPSTVWVSEFSNCNPSIFRQMITTYQHDSRVARYAAFTVRGWDDTPCMNLVDGDENLTPLGWVWKNDHDVE